MNATINLEKNHFPVLLNELISIISPLYGGTFIDCTFGQGGYSKKILENRLAKCLDEQTKNIIIARRSYHSINNKYWWSSIFILVFSSIITFIEAVRLIIENTENKKIKALTYAISISSIFIGMAVVEHDHH